MLALRGNHLDVAAALVAAGADTKVKAQDGSSLLMAAVSSGHVEAVKYAWQFDQDPKVVTDNGTTLMHASVTGTVGAGTLEDQLRVCEVVSFLASHGAPLDEKNAKGKTPIDIADILPMTRP